MVKRIISIMTSVILAAGLVTITGFAAGTELSGSCGDDATWKITKDGALVLSGTGEVTSYSGWYTYRHDIEEVVIQEGITSAAYNILCINSCPNVKKITLPTTFAKLKGMTNNFAFLKDIYVYSRELSQKDIDYNAGTFPMASSGVKWHIYKGSGTEDALRKCRVKYTDADFVYIEGNKPEDPQYTAAVISDQSETSGPSGVSSTWSWDEGTKTLTFSGTGSISITAGYSKYSASAEKVVINDGIKIISQKAFEGFSSLTSVMFADSVELIDDYAFSGTKLTEFIAPQNLVKIGRQAFYQLPITKIDLNENLNWIGDSAFENTPVESIKFLSGDIYVGQQAFAHTKLTNIELCEGMHFGGTVFSFCNTIKEVTVPVGCTYDQNGEGNAVRSNKLFGWCEGLEKVIIEDGASIAEAMFTKCTALKDVYILTKTAAVNISKRSQEESAFGKNPTYHIYKGSTAETALKTSGYLTDDNFVYLTDTTELEKAIADGEAVDASKYTDDSVKVLTDAITAAKAVMENVDVTNEEVESAAKLIEDAIKGLVEKPTQPSPPKSEPTKPEPSNSITKTPSKAARSKEAVKKDKSAAKKAMKQAKISKFKVKSKAKKKINVSWKKVKKAKGYQVQVSAKKNFKKVIFKKDLKKTKLTIKNNKIKSKKTYFVRVRAYATYKNANNKTVKVYSKWNKKLRKITVK